MRPSKLNYYSDFVVYPVVIVGLAAIGVARASWADRTEWLCVGVAGFLLWTLVEYVLHRYVLHEQTCTDSTTPRRCLSSARLLG
jgi:hypothetical protein